MKQNYFFIVLFFPFFLIGQTTITSTESLNLSAYSGATNLPGQGEYQIFKSPDDILDKPIILVDGFDPQDTRDISGIYTLLDYADTSGTENLADFLRAEGYDIVILNFPIYTDSNGNEIDGGTDFIERNAMVLLELLNIINIEKAPNSPDQNVIIGPSMGGLIARYALNYMESETLNADTRLFISFDSPHHGANIPIGLQHQLNYLAFNNINPVQEVEPVINGLLKSPASRQLLTDHFEAHLAPASTVDFDPSLNLPQEHPFRTIFKTQINSLTPSGFPEMVRNVAISNGSYMGSPYFAIGNSGPVVTNGGTIINTTLSVPAPPFTANVVLQMNFTPSAGTTETVSSISIQLFGNEIAGSQADSESFSYSDGIDAAPGGLFDLSSLTGDLASEGGLAADFINALQIDKFSFIPTVSALALEAENDELDWFENIDLNGTNSTPFDNTYSPDNNEPHVLLTESNVAFALMEIMNPPLTVNENALNNFKLEKNPIDDTLVILSNKNTLASISITDASGKLIFKTKESLAARHSLPVELASGFYILNITTESNSTFTTKFLVN